MKIVIMTDLEGVSGVTSWNKHVYPTSPYCKESMELLTGEVNAAIEGLLDYGVEDILVLDTHGWGGICFNQIHPAAKVFHGDIMIRSKEFKEIIKEYDATMMVGQHSMSETIGGNLAHTQCEKSIKYYKLNGKMIGEIAQWALYCGALDIPMFFLSGDEAACKEAREFIPQITAVSVKKGVSVNSAVSLSKESARDKIRKGVIEAMSNFKKNPILPLKWQGEYILEIQFYSNETANGYLSNFNCEKIDEKTVRLKSNNILDIIYA